MVYKSTSRIYDFRGFKTIRTYGNDIRNNVTSLKAANLEQANLMAHLYDFTKNTKPQNSEQKKLKSDVLNSMGALAKGREVIVCFYHVTYAFQSESTLYSCLNVKELLARSRREI